MPKIPKTPPDKFQIGLPTSKDTMLNVALYEVFTYLNIEPEKQISIMGMINRDEERFKNILILLEKIDTEKNKKIKEGLFQELRILIF